MKVQVKEFYFCSVLFTFLLKCFGSADAISLDGGSKQEFVFLTFLHNQNFTVIFVVCFTRERLSELKLLVSKEISQVFEGLLFSVVVLADMTSFLLVTYSNFEILLLIE